MQSLFLFDRDLRILFLKYILIFENSFKTVLSHKFSKKYPKPNSYLKIQNYNNNSPKKVLQQISILTKTIHDKVDKNGAVKHYIEDYGYVPLWILVNYLTIGNLAYLYDILKDEVKNTIAMYYSIKFEEQYHKTPSLIFSSEDLDSALKIINLARNKCAHDERLYNSNFGNIRSSNISNYFEFTNYDNKKIIAAILYLKVLLDKKYFKNFYSELELIFNKYQDVFTTVPFCSILDI